MSRVHRVDSEAEAWADLRATRFSPPGNATRNAERRAVYVAALEQAEQLFASAAVAGCASRPLLIFYGLSQAGRALAAVGGMPPGSGWQLRSHGLKATDLTKPLVDLPLVQTSQRDASFVSLSGLLNSPPLPTDASTPVTFSELWSTIPEAQDRPLRTESQVRPPLPYSPSGPGVGPHPLATGTLLRVPRWLAQVEDRATNFKEFMAAYPQAAGYMTPHRGGDPSYPTFNVFPHDVQIQMHWYVHADKQQATYEEQMEKLSEVLTRYNDEWYLIAPLAGNTAPLHPLMAWWALLYALSMLARYQPAQWTSYIDVNHSEYAVALEAVLDEALLAVPRLVHSTLTEIS